MGSFSQGREKSKLQSGNKNESFLKSGTESRKGQNKTKDPKDDSNIFGISENLDEESFTVSLGTKNVNMIFKNRLGTGVRKPPVVDSVYESQDLGMGQNGENDEDMDEQDITDDNFERY